VKVRKVLYYGLWPFEKVAFFLGWLVRVLRMLVIVTNPVFLAIYLVNRRGNRKGEEGSS
jgi:hypothetical protein